jgi:putative ABC transport system permease protein
VAGPEVDSAANRRIDRWSLPWTLIIAITALAVVMATFSAWWPARSMSRLPVMSALSGRPAPPRPVHRSITVSLLTFAAGIAAIAYGRPRNEHTRPLFLIAGVLLAVAGVVLISPAAIRALAAPARRLPFAVRLALRDLARHQARAAAALAAITLGISICVAVIGVAAASESTHSLGNLTSRQLMVHRNGPLAPGGTTLTAAQAATLDQQAQSIAAALGRNTAVLPLDVAINPDSPANGPGSEGVAVFQMINAHEFNQLATAYVATPEALARLSVDPASISATVDLLTTQTGDLTLLDGTRDDVGAPPPVVQKAELPRNSSAPNTLITTAAIRRHGWVTVRDAWYVTTPAPLTTSQIRAARVTAAQFGLDIEVRNHPDSLAALRTWATTIGIALALAIVSMAIGLIRGESARDTRTMTATGAAPRTRRTITSATAASLALLGVVLGVVGAYTVLIVVYRSSLDRLWPLPLAELASIAIGLPVTATLVGWLLAGREPHGFSRQALD